MAGPLGVTHMLLLTATETACYLRVAKSPRVSQLQSPPGGSAPLVVNRPDAAQALQGGHTHVFVQASLRASHRPALAPFRDDLRSVMHCRARP